MIGIIGIILAILFLMIGSYKGLAALPLTVLAALIVVVTNGINLWESVATLYMNGYVGTYLNYFMIFCCSSLYAHVMTESGSTLSIAYQLLGWFGKKRVILASILIVAILTYGGVSLFVVMFAVGPILYTMFQEADLPRHLIAAVLFAGSCTFTMTCLPGSPQLTNIIPSQYLGTPLTAAPVFGIIAAVALFLMDYAYCEYCAVRARKRGEHWSFQKNFDASKYQASDRSSLPSAIQAFSPMLLLILFIFIGGKFITNSAMLSVCAMLIGSASCYLLSFNKFKSMDLRKILASLNNGITSIGSLSAVCGFGAVVQGSAAYARIVENVTSWQMSPYMMAVLSTAVLAAVAGSSSGGARLMLSSMSEHFLSTGANMQIMHRLISISAGSLDSMPHATGIFLFNDYLEKHFVKGEFEIFLTVKYFIVPNSLLRSSCGERFCDFPVLCDGRAHNN